LLYRGGLEEYLIESACNQAFKPWELGDNLRRMKIERAVRPPEVRVLEMLHKAAFRKGLGYSLYSPKYMVGKHTSEMVSGEHCISYFLSISSSHLSHDECKLNA